MEIKSAVILLAVFTFLAFSVNAQGTTGGGVLSPTVLEENTCYNCHIDEEDPELSDAARDWDDSIHKEEGIGCERCHAAIVPIGRLSLFGEFKGSYRDDHKDLIISEYTQQVSSELFVKKPAFESKDPELTPVEGVEGEYSVVVRKGLSSQQIMGICARCHGLTPIDPDSPKDVFVDFRNDVHGQAAMVSLGDPDRLSALGLEAADGEDSPVCAGCHDSHRTKRFTDEESKVHVTKIAATCASEECHGSDKVAKKYDMVNALETYEENNIMGRMLAIGNPNAPGCGNCHGGHGILPSEDPDSSTNPANVREVCAQEDCHPTYENVKLKGKVHLTFPPSAVEAPLEYASYYFMVGLLLFVMVVFIPIVALDITRKAGEKFKKGGE